MSYAQDPSLSVARQEARSSMDRARELFTSWSQTSLEERASLLRGLNKVLVKEMDDIVDAIVEMTGKPRLEALAGDVFTCMEMIDYYAKEGSSILSEEKRAGRPLFLGSSFHVEYLPLGVVAIIAPWNYPLQLSFIPVISALMAGNCVILKPSEVTPAVGELIVELCEKAGFPSGVVQVLQGRANMGQALIEAKPDKVFFTGSVATGKKVMAVAAENLTPLELELGGKDAMIVFEDAFLKRAARAAVYGAFSNGGQACVSVERLYVQESVYERFIGLVQKEAQKVRWEDVANADYGPVIHSPQLEIIQEHIDEALEKGATLVSSREQDGNRLSPVILVDVNHDMKVMKEETFGPVLGIMPFSTKEDAIELANDSIYGLNASVWTKDKKKGREVARRLVVGNCAINDVLKNISNPSMPFGGEKQSGFGRYHGPEGLKSFSRQQSIMASEGSFPWEFNWFPYSQPKYQVFKMMLRVLYKGPAFMEQSFNKIKNMLASWSQGKE